MRSVAGGRLTAFRPVAFGSPGARGVKPAVSRFAGPLTSGRIYPTGRHCHRENRGQVLVENLKRAGGSREGRACPCVCQIPGAPPPPTPAAGRGEAQEGSAREAGCVPCGDRSGEAKLPMRASASADRGPCKVRISVGSKALKLRGIVNFWSSEHEYAMPKTAGGPRRRKACGSTEGKRSAGRTP
jgi:hypothetical protein